MHRKHILVYLEHNARVCDCKYRSPSAGGSTNSGLPNALAGFDGTPRGRDREGKGRERTGTEGTVEKKHPRPKINVWLYGLEQNAREHLSGSTSGGK